MFDKIVGSIGAFSYRNRKVISVIALVLFVAVIILQSQLVIEYSYAEENIVSDIFPQDDTVVIVYENKDEAKIAEIISYLENNEHVTSVQGYANTLGTQMSPSDVAELLGVPVSFVNTLFYIHQNGMDVSGMTLVEFAGFITSDDFLNNELFSSMIDDETKAQIKQMESLVNALASDKEYSSEEIADILGVDKHLVQSVFFVASLKEANLLNVKPATSLKFTEFVDILAEIAENVNKIVEIEQLAQLSTLKEMSDMVQEQREISPLDIATLFAGAAESDMFDENTLNLLYIMAKSNTVDLTNVTISLYDLFMFLSEEILPNEAFAPFFDDSVVAQFKEAEVTMQEGLAQLVGEDHSRMLITLNYKAESEEIDAFYKDFHATLESTLSGEYYLVGSTAMSYEVEQSFATEFLIISIVTAIAVFIVVCITFKKFFLSLMLVGVIECAVFSMMSVMVVMSEPMYFIPLILVQCILMGSMIDYAILFTTYYIEVRKEYSGAEVLPEVMRRATHAILTSSLVIVLVTLICGRLMSGAVASILTTLGIGSLCAILLILFVLPSLLVIFDKFVIKEEKEEIDEFDN
ncbi:MAG: MMPL family transporter [Clostridia bacterium]|nr:MMPL family transporter [Clostridia bacterium]